MRVRKRKSDEALQIAITGLLRASPRSIQLFNDINDAINGTIKTLSMDVGGVLFFDSLWLGFMVTLALKCRNHGVSFELSSVSRQLWHAVTHSHLDCVLPAPGSIESAKPRMRTHDAPAAASGNGRSAR